MFSPLVCGLLGPGLPLAVANRYVLVRVFAAAAEAAAE